MSGPFIRYMIRSFLRQAQDERMVLFRVEYVEKCSVLRMNLTYQSTARVKILLIALLKTQSVAL
jgi:hypothetical protein